MIIIYAPLLAVSLLAFTVFIIYYYRFTLIQPNYFKFEPFMFLLTWRDMFVQNNQLNMIQLIKYNLYIYIVVNYVYKLFILKVYVCNINLIKY